MCKHFIIYGIPNLEQWFLNEMFGFKIHFTMEILVLIWLLFCYYYQALDTVS